MIATPSPVFATHFRYSCSSLGDAEAFAELVHRFMPWRSRALLGETKALAMESSLTGGLRRGAGTLVTMYNRCRATLEATDPTIAELFPPMDPNADVDTVGMAAALLRRYAFPDEGKRRFRDL